MDADIERVLLTEETIRDRVVSLAAEVSREFGGGEITTVGVLTGGFIFLADLVRRLKNPVRVAFACATSYDAGTRPGELCLSFVAEADLAGRDVLIVEDILDTGRSLHGILGAVREQEPRSLRTAVLLDKPDRREVEVPVEFTGFTVPDEFLVGYGLDYAHRYRNLPYVGILRRSVYEGGS